VVKSCGGRNKAVLVVVYFVDCSSLVLVPVVQVTEVTDDRLAFGKGGKLHIDQTARGFIGELFEELPVYLDDFGAAADERHLTGTPLFTRKDRAETKAVSSAEHFEGHERRSVQAVAVD